MVKHPSIYEINTRVWIKRFSHDGNPIKLIDVPDDYWNNLFNKGIDYVWLMGVWQTCESTVKKYCFEDGLIKEYKKALKDYKEEDVIGSPYAVDTYTLNPILGETEDLIKLKKRLNKLGLKLILDYIPNHFSAHSVLIETHPDIFLYANEEHFENDSHTFFKPDNNPSHIFAHGRDPFFPAWQDTIQVNYFSITAREFMINTLLQLTNYCDGVRCDMAMLALNNVFKNTWGGITTQMGYKKPDDEFWEIAIKLIKDTNPEFIFLAEVYWDLEYALQNLGFDYTYDKSLTDRIRVGSVPDTFDHLRATYEYQNKSIRFIENHDEQRALTLFGKEKSRAAAVIISTLQGMRFYHDGQFEGKRIKLPVQLGREPIEENSECISNFYDKLLEITKEDIFKKGDWKLLSLSPSWNNNHTFRNMLAWEWYYEGQRRLVIINFSDRTSSGRIQLDMIGYPEAVKMKDLLNNEEYIRQRRDLATIGLYVELDLYKCHILAY